MRVRRGWIISAIAVVVLLGIAYAVFYVWKPQFGREEVVVAPKPEAPPDLAKLRTSFIAGVDALRRGDGHEAIKQLGAFSFGSRAVEQYRLYFLAQAHELAGETAPARATLAGLWTRSPRLVGWDQIGTRLAGKYAERGDDVQASEIAAEVAARSDAPAVAASARWQVIESAFVTGDVSLMLHHARQIAIKSPRAPQAGTALDVVRALSGVAAGAPVSLTPAERLERGVALMRDGDPQHALDELTALDGASLAPDLRQPLQLNRGLALNQVRRYEDSNRMLEQLTAGPYKVAIPAIYTASKNYRVLSKYCRMAWTKRAFSAGRLVPTRMKRSPKPSLRLQSRT